MVGGEGGKRDGCVSFEGGGGFVFRSLSPSFVLLLQPSASRKTSFSHSLVESSHSFLPPCFQRTLKEDVLPPSLDSNAPLPQLDLLSDPDLSSTLRRSGNRFRSLFVLNILGSLLRRSEKEESRKEGSSEAGRVEGGRYRRRGHWAHW